MNTYSATSTREDGWWVVTVPGIGATQGRNTAEAQRMAVDLVSVMLEIPADEVTVDIDFRPPGGLAEEVRRARTETKKAAEAQRRAADLLRTAVRKLLEAGLSKQDAARILKVAPQRISQLVKL
ncbi:MAG TPA: hypothetical protein VG317_00670 [Pseudonocardiaceae bacterium]|nr:hypothetical protein [Pseudonocardiaceae bacterium]